MPWPRASGRYARLRMRALRRARMVAGRRWRGHPNRRYGGVSEFRSVDGEMENMFSRFLVIAVLDTVARQLLYF